MSTAPYVARHEPGAVSSVLADADRTGGALGVVVLELPAGTEPPFRVHRGEDVAYVVLEGVAAFTVGGTTVEACSGTLVACPRNVPHGFVLRTPTARLLVLVTPAGLEAFVAAAARIDPGDTQLLLSLAAEHRCDVLAPPLP